MSSTIEGRDDWAREDELDLGQENAELHPYRAGDGVIMSNGDEPRDEMDDSMIVGKEGGSFATDNRHHLAGAPVEDQPKELLPRASGSVDEITSTPDDTPSLHGSLLSSHSGSALAFRGSPRASLSPSHHHRPFDLRFQSRLSSPSHSGFRPSSPFLNHFRSRQSSLASQLSPADSGTEASDNPWDVVRWTKLRKIAGQVFSELGKRNFGRPTCVAVSTSIVIGTSKGVILVFDYQQTLRAIIGLSTKAVECGAITSLAISADHSTVAGGHASGDIFTWEISKSARPFLHIRPIPSTQIDRRTSDGHVFEASVIHVGFLGTRRTALVSADERGMAFSHLATRGMGAVGRTVKTARILGRYPQSELAGSKPRKPSSVLAFSPLPLGNVGQPTDSLGLVAMLTPYLLVIVSTTPVARTQHKAPRPREVAAHGAMTGALAWFPAIKLKGKDSEISKTKLVYCWSNVLTVLDVSEINNGSTNSDNPPSLLFKPRSRWKAEEAIVAVQWLSRSVMAVLTITQQLLILEDYSLRVTESVDLLHRHIYHADLFSSQLHNLVEQFDEEDMSMHGVVADAFYMSFRAYKGRLFLLSYNDVSVGSLSNWADRLFSLMEVGDFIGAIRLATSYYRGNAEKLTIGLPEEDALRHPIVRDRLVEMISASLKYAFGRNEGANNERLENRQLEELAETSISACVCLADKEFLWEEVFTWYEEHGAQGIFLDALEPYIVDGTLRSLPPTAVKALINHFAKTHTASRLEEIICLLDAESMDIDQVTTLCRHYNLYEAYIYVWNRCLGDYVGPLQELLTLIPSRTELLVNGESLHELKQQANAMKMFPYLSFIFTGRVYPTGDDMDEDESVRAKSALYHYLFSGNLPFDVAEVENPTFAQDNDSFSGLRAMLKFDAASSMSMLNEAFEDSFLNDHEESEASFNHGVSINRQYLITILLQVMDPRHFSPSDTIYLDMFIARNLPKYPQYILLSGTILQQVLVRLCDYSNEEMAEDCELSAEYLLSIYHPPDIQAMVPLFKKARFFRILKSTYSTEKMFPELILTYLDDQNEQEAVFTRIQDCLRPGSGLSKKRIRDVVNTIKSQARKLAGIDVTKAAHTMQAVAPETHATFLEALTNDPYDQYEYLVALIEPQTKKTAVEGKRRRPKAIENWMLERYVQLLCKYNPSHVADFVDDLRTGDVRLEKLLPSMEESGVVDAAVILLARQGQVRAAMDRLIAHLGTLQSGLVGILQSVEESPDSASTAEAIDDLVESLNKYARVGTWLCQGQTKTSRRPREAVVKTNGKHGMAALEKPLSFDESLWLDLIEAVVRIASNVFTFLRGTQPGQSCEQLVQQSTSHPGSAPPGRLISSFRGLVQQVFTALLSNTLKGATSPSATGTASIASDRTDVSFLRILRAFLTRAVTWSPSLFELRAVLASIFSAYTYEQSLLSLANGMLDRDLFVHVNEVTRLRQQGWRPRGQVCEICRRRIWGPGAGSQYWEAWEKKRSRDHQKRVAKRAESSIDPAAHGGKGKAVAVGVGVGIDGDYDEVGDGDGTDGSGRFDVPRRRASQGTLELASTLVPGPVVVFACRHLYHRGCLLEADSESGRLGMEPVCPVCR